MCADDGAVSTGVEPAAVPPAVALRQHYRNPEPTKRPASQICGRAVPGRTSVSRTLNGFYSGCRRVSATNGGTSPTLEDGRLGTERLNAAADNARGVNVPAERIERLHDLAREAARDGETDLAKRYVRRARRVAERNRISLPTRFKRFTCDRCDAYLVPGRNARVRTRDGHVVVTCDCGEHARYPYRE